MVNKNKKEIVERVTLKLPKSVAIYFRAEFPHGKRSLFVEECLMEYKHNQEVAKIEKDLHQVGKIRK